MCETKVCCFQLWRATGDADRGEEVEGTRQKLAFVLEQFANHDAAFIFGCELGGLRQGVAATQRNMGNIVRSALPTAEWQTSGAYFSIHNCLAELPKVTMVQSGVFEIPCGRKVDLFWQMFTVDYRDDDDKETTRGAAQPADSIGKKSVVGLSVGILHITMPPKGS